LAVCPADGEAIASIIRLARLADSNPPVPAPSVAPPPPSSKGHSPPQQIHPLPDFVEPLANDVTLDMVAIPAGEFWMGAKDNEQGASKDEYPRHTVKVPAFYLGRYPVTQAQWAAVAKLKKVKIDLQPDPANFKGKDRPVEQISWWEAVEFCERGDRKTGKTYRLPSEAEWEYACRAGSETPFHFGDTLSTKIANYNGNSTYGKGVKEQYRQQTTPVGSFPPNAFGLHDMHGNVWEWCADHWHENYDRAPQDGSAWIEGGNSDRRRLRGGSWSNDPADCRSACRFTSKPARRNCAIGFRVVTTPRKASSLPWPDATCLS
jgi:formylglycine-generating enzyme required for sulfatase activity